MERIAAVGVARFHLRHSHRHEKAPPQRCFNSRRSLLKVVERAGIKVE